MSNAAACRQLGIDRKTGHWWNNGGVIVRNGGTRVVERIVGTPVAAAAASRKYLSEEERIVIADGVRAGSCGPIGRIGDRVGADQRRGRFAVPLRMIEECSADAMDRQVPGHWEGDLIVGAFNRSAIGTLVDGTSRFTILVHLAAVSRAQSARSADRDLRRLA